MKVLVMMDSRELKALPPRRRGTVAILMVRLLLPLVLPEPKRSMTAGVRVVNARWRWGLPAA